MLDLVYNYSFTSQRASHSVPDMLELLRKELTKLTINYFKGKL